MLRRAEMLDSDLMHTHCSYENPPLWRIFIPPLLISIICVVAGYFTNFLIFHTIAELFSVFIGFTAFTVSITSSQFTKNQFIVFISIAAGWCGCLDVAHILAYKGMNLLPHGGGNESSQLWISARFLQAVSFVIAPWFFRHSLRIRYINLGFAIITIAFFTAIFTEHFPQTYIESSGVTLFKILSEWGIVLILLLALTLLWRDKAMMAPNLIMYLTLAIISMIFSGVAISNYTNLYGTENIVGHILKIYAYWFIYIALVVNTLRQPFSMLSRAVSTYDNIPDPTFIVQSDGVISEANAASNKFILFEREKLIGESSHPLFHDKTIEVDQCPVCSQLQIAKDKFMVEIEVEKGIWVECSLSPIDTDLFPNAWVQVVRTITDRKLLEIERTRLVFDLGERIKELSCLNSITNLVVSKMENIEGLLEETVKILPQAFQFPESIVVCIDSIWGKFSSKSNAHHLSFQIEKEMIIQNEPKGKLQVSCSAFPPVNGSLFLPEEFTLVNSVVAILTSAINKILSERLFQQSEEHFKAIIDQTGVGVYICSKTKFLYVNPRFCKIIGMEKEDLLNVGLLDLVDDENTRKYILEQWNILYQGSNSINYQFPLNRKDGDTLILRIDATTIFWKGKYEYLASVQDITEIDNAQHKIKDYVQQLEAAIKGIFSAVSNMVELRDPYTAGHERRVGLIAKAIGAELGWTAERCASLELMGLVHDIGKIYVPAEILSKPTKLTDIEMQIIKVHPQAGYDILKGINFKIPVAEVILQHHERLDGTGYPRGLKGEAILPETRIISVADVLEAMSSFRPYRPALGIEVAVEEIKRGRGTQYDPEVVDAVIKLINKDALASIFKQ